jgi:ABC-type tungstate transport system substrate-binding protein
MNELPAFFAALLFFLGLILTLCAIVMPLYVIMIHGAIRRLEKRLTEMHKLASWAADHLEERAP